MARKVLITGSGIAGLTAGLWLNKQGFETTIAEQADAPLGGGFLVSLSDKAYQFARELGVLDAMKEKDMHIAQSSYHNRRKTALMTLETKHLFEGVDVLQIMRDDVVDVLYQVAQKKLNFQFKDKITAIENLPDKVEVQFQSGKQETFDLVVIAEGANSSTRALAFPDSVEIDYLNLCCAAFRLPNVLGLNNKFETHMEKGRYMATFTTPADDLGAVFVWTSKTRQIPDGAAQKQMLIAAYENTGERTREALKHCPDQPHYMDSLKQIKAKSWVNGRTVLIGDAAHCMTLFSGRGAAAAITGATRLANNIERYPLPEALKRFEEENRRIIDPIQRQTRKAVRWYAPQNNIDWWLRDNAMRFVPNWLFQSYFNRKYSNV
jgi:2-polyprenyl-6-methoxyphenol hydroxylase-like FAD-dependent oxidoreductase